MRGRVAHEVIRKADLLQFIEEALVSPAPVERGIEANANENRWLYAHGTVLHDAQRRKIGALIVLHDITRLRHLENVRRDFVANVSHELRTPIANIRLIIDSLFHEDEKPKRKRSISSLQAIARETDSLLWIMQEMLDLSMIESGQAIFRMVDVSLRDLVRDVIERMEDQSAAKDLKMEADVPKKLQALCDADQIGRVLLNLDEFITRE